MAQMIFEQNLEKAFLLVLNMSLTSCAVIAAVLLTRLALRRAPKIFSYVLWAAVLFRLLCPVSFSLPFSLLGALRNEPAKTGRMEYIAENVGYMAKPEIALPVPGLSGAVNQLLPEATPETSANPMQIYLALGAYLWLSGVFCMGIYSAVSLGRLQKRVKGAVLCEKYAHQTDGQAFGYRNVYRIAENVSPFVYGLFSPRIYLPEKMEEAEERYILLHEQIHIRRGDAVFRLLAFLALWLHWFNPLVWAAFFLSGRDMEMSCDEAVIKRLGSGVKKEYSALLLHVAAGSRIARGIPGGVPLAFGESDTKSRIKNVLRYRKRTALLIGTLAVVSALLFVFFLANPAKEEEREDMPGAAVKEAKQEQDVASVQTENSVSEAAETPVQTDAASGEVASEFLEVSPEQLRNGELSDGMYVVYARSIARSGERGFDAYVTWEEETDLPLFPFAENCEFWVNRERSKIVYSPVSIDKFEMLILQLTKVINPVVYCEVENNRIVRAYLESPDNALGISYEKPLKAHWAEDVEQITGMTKEEVLAEYYVLAGTESADIADSAGEETIEIYTGNIGDGDSGVVLFKDAAGNLLGTEDAHTARAGWNNIYLGEADGVGFILTVEIEDRDTYGGYRYQVFRLGAAGEIMQIAGSAFMFGGNYEYVDETFRSWAEDLSYYLERSHLILSSQEGEIRTERVSEADKYNYETLRREP